VRPTDATKSQVALIPTRRLRSVTGDLVGLSLILGSDGSDPNGLGDSFCFAFGAGVSLSGCVFGLSATVFGPDLILESIWSLFMGGCTKGARCLRPSWRICAGISRKSHVDSPGDEVWASSGVPNQPITDHCFCTAWSLASDPGRRCHLTSEANTRTGNLTAHDSHGSGGLRAYIPPRRYGSTSRRCDPVPPTWNTT